MKRPGRLRKSLALPGWTRAGLAFAFLAGLSHSLAQLPDETVSFRSFSGQFVVQAPRMAAAPEWSQLDTNPAYIRLDPRLIPVSCERIRQQVWRATGISGPWAASITIGLYPAAVSPDHATVLSDRFRDGWSYRVEMPLRVRKQVYVRALVQVCLQEFANRHASARSAEIPRWLIEGLTEEVLGSREIEVILPPPRQTGKGVLLTAATWESKRLNPLESLQERLKTSPALSFEQISWPGPDAFTGSAGDQYRSSAHLFVKNLQALKDGRACLRTMLEQLPNYYNWQFAFLQGFRGQFERPLDVEKWWTLRLLQLANRDLAQRWSLEDSLAKLKKCLAYPVQVFATTNDLPLHAEVGLQTVLRDWQEPEQNLAIQRALLGLQQVRLLAAIDAVPIIDGYSEALHNFLQARPKRRDGLKADLIKQLDGLDARAEALRILRVTPDTNPPPALTFSPPGMGSAGGDR